MPLSLIVDAPAIASPVEPIGPHHVYFRIFVAKRYAVEAEDDRKVTVYGPFLDDVPMEPSRDNKIDTISGRHWWGDHLVLGYYLIELDQPCLIRVCTWNLWHWLRWLWVWLIAG